MTQFGPPDEQPGIAAPPPAYQPTPVGTNTLGLVGFIVSLVGVLTLGCLAPVGLLLSAIALLKAPRGFAAAGTIISVLTLGTAAGVAVVAWPTVRAEIEQQIAIEANDVMLVDAFEIESYVLEHRAEIGVVPASIDGLGIDPYYLFDEWGNAYLYQQASDGPGFLLISLGPDGQPRTDDDVTYTLIDPDNAEVEWTLVTGPGPISDQSLARGGALDSLAPIADFWRFSLAEAGSLPPQGEADPDALGLGVELDAW